MKLTATEAKLLKQLRNREMGMFRTRYWFIALGIISYIAAGYGCFLMQRWSYKNSQMPPEFYAKVAPIFYTFIFPIVLAMAAQGSYFLGTAIRDWHGNSIRVLLLKLIDEHTEKTNDSNQNT